MPISENMAVVTYQLVKSKKRIDSFFSIMKGSIDTSTVAVREDGYRAVDELLTRLLLDGEPELFRLMKSPRATQDRYIAKTRRSFGLTGKPVDLAKSKTVRELRLPKAAEMFNDLRKGKQIGSFTMVHKEEDAAFETCVINHVENDNMSREDAILACRKNTGDSDERREALREDKSRTKSTDELFKAIMEKKGHNAF